MVRWKPPIRYYKIHLIDACGNVLCKTCIYKYKKRSKHNIMFNRAVGGTAKNAIAYFFDKYMNLMHTNNEPFTY